LIGKAILMAFVLLLSAFAFYNATKDVQALPPPRSTLSVRLYVEPQIIQKAVGDIVTVSVKVFNLSNYYVSDADNPDIKHPLGNLYGFEFRLNWDPTVLTYLSHGVWVPVQSIPGGVLHEPTLEFKNLVNSVAGTYDIAYSSSAPAPGFNNPGESNTIFTMRFQVIGTKATAPTLSPIPPSTQAKLSDIHGKAILHSKQAPGDINWDGIVDIYDLFELGSATGSANPGENYVRAMAVDGGYLYAGLYTDPGKIVKVDLSTFTKVSTLTFGANEGNITSLAVSGGYLYAGLDTPTGKIVKVDLSTFTKVSTLTLLVTDKYLSSLVVNGTYLYAGCYRSPGRVVKINIAHPTFSRSGALTLSTGEGPVRSLVTPPSGKIYAGIYTFPGKIVKISQGEASPTKDAVLTLAADENDTRALVVSGNYLYAGMDAVPGKIAKVDLTTFTKSSTLTLGASEGEVRSLVVDGSYLYTGLDTIPGKIVKVDLSTFTAVSTLTLGSGEDRIASLVASGSYLYAGLLTAPARIVKVDLSTFAKVSTLTPTPASGKWSEMCDIVNRDNAVNSLDRDQGLTLIAAHYGESSL